MKYSAARGLNATRVELTEPLDLGVFICDQALPVEALACHRPSEASRVIDGMAKLARINEELFRDAAANDAGAAIAIFLGDRGADAKPGRKPRDTVKVLEDFGPDGRARKVTTFADGLNIPIGVLPLPGSKPTDTLVFSIPNIYRFRDSTGKGVATLLTSRNGLLVSTVHPERT